MNIRYSSIIENTYVDGAGCRTAIFFQGCPIHCQGCQNKHLWSFDGGYSIFSDKLAKKIIDSENFTGRVTISGGEPFAQRGGLLEFVRELRQDPRTLDIIVYSGFDFETLIKTDTAQEIFKLIDILVDGQYIAGQDDDFLVYRGSRNQRAIDTQKTMETGELCLVDWDNPEIVIGKDGIIHLPIGLGKMFSGVGDVQTTRMCGQTAGYAK